MSIEARIAVYERLKKVIAQEAKTKEEYEKRVKALAKKLKV